MFSAVAKRVQALLRDYGPMPHDRIAAASRADCAIRDYGSEPLSEDEVVLALRELSAKDAARVFEGDWSLAARARTAS